MESPKEFDHRALDVSRIANGDLHQLMKADGSLTGFSSLGNERQPWV
jgi:hypothetical protein